MHETLANCTEGYMLRRCFSGALEFLATRLAKRLELGCAETRCAAQGDEHCVFETGKRGPSLI